MKKSNVYFLHIANSDKPVKFYSLNVIISVGYRVKSQRDTQFRIWANRVPLISPSSPSPDSANSEYPVPADILPHRLRNPHTPKRVRRAG